MNTLPFTSLRQTAAGNSVRAKQIEQTLEKTERASMNLNRKNIERVRSCRGLLPCLLGPLFVAACATPPQSSSEPTFDNLNEAATEPAPVVTPKTVHVVATEKVATSARISLEGWPSETFALPPDFAPELPAGSESLRFAPGWRDPSTQDFWSYAFVMSIDETAPDKTRVGELLNLYYDGLMRTFAHGKEIGSDPAQIVVTQITPQMFEAEMYVIDAFATFNPIEVRILIDTVSVTEASSVVHIRLSPQPKEHAIWRSLEAAIANIEDVRLNPTN
ncbi:MAG: hypothetical protein ACI8TQ_003016 [Planctomycetota bacterium]|jgi:hypothetical protein